MVFTFCFAFVFSNTCFFVVGVTVIAVESSGPETRDKRNRHKRAAKGAGVISPPKMKKIKVSQDTIDIYDRFVGHSRKLKRQEQQP